MEAVILESRDQRAREGEGAIYSRVTPLNVFSTQVKTVRDNPHSLGLG